MNKFSSHQNTLRKMIQEVIKKFKGDSIPFLTMYFVFKGVDEPIIRLVDIDKSVADDFASKFRNYLTENYGQQHLVVGNVSDADERKYDALIFDIDTVSPLEKLQELLSNPDATKYKHSKDKDLKLDGYIFIMGNDKVKVSFYKENYTLDSITRDSYTMFGRSDSRFVSVQEDQIFRLNSKIDFLQASDNLYVLNMQVMETNFKIHNVLKKKAENFISEIKADGFVDNPEYIIERINENPSFARKVLKVNKESPVMKLPFKDLKTFVDKHPHLNGKLKFNKRGTKFALDTKTSAQLFIKLMDDDFLKSELTQKLYDSITKDRLETENNIKNSKKANKKDK